MTTLAWVAGAFFLAAATALWFGSLNRRRWSKGRSLGYVVVGIVGLQMSCDVSIDPRSKGPRLFVIIGSIIAMATGIRMLGKLEIWSITRQAWRTPLFLAGVSSLAVAVACWIFLGYTDGHGWRGDPHPNLVGVGMLSWLAFLIGIVCGVVGAVRAKHS